MAHAMKPILKSQDLAINGAPPTFDQLLHVGHPNMGSREMFMKYVDEIFDRRWLSNNGPMVNSPEAVKTYLDARLDT